MLWPCSIQQRAVPAARLAAAGSTSRAIICGAASHRPGAAAATTANDCCDNADNHTTCYQSMPSITPLPITVPSVPPSDPMLSIPMLPVAVPLPSMTNVLLPSTATVLLPPTITVADDGIDRSEWSESLVAAYAYLMEKEWGPRWTMLLSVLVEHEWSFYHPEEDGKLSKLRSHPMEYEDWMKEHRLMRDFEIGQEFGDELFHNWWLLDWSKLHKRGHNSIILLILGLVWWGQSICNASTGDRLGAGEAALEANTVWQFMVDDIKWVLRDVLTQGRIGMEGLTMREEEAAREEAEATRVKNGSVLGKQKKTGAPQKEKAAARGKKRTQGEHEDNLPPAKKAMPERPKPKPLTRDACRALENGPSNMDEDVPDAASTAPGDIGPTALSLKTTETMAKMVETSAGSSGNTTVTANMSTANLASTPQSTSSVSTEPTPLASLSLASQMTPLCSLSTLKPNQYAGGDGYHCDGAQGSSGNGSMMVTTYVLLACKLSRNCAYLQGHLGVPIRRDIDDAVNLSIW
ncbi:hypothetical protein B0H14DRAFT_2558683 [Mycena olivaceomarginata]|nr:hypothetical protein B0H14DRAFT_2558683 [Mycena olivaceomarginata]